MDYDKRMKSKGQRAKKEKKKERECVCLPFEQQKKENTKIQKYRDPFLVFPYSLKHDMSSQSLP